jgi:hypothetical protein
MFDVRKHRWAACRNSLVYLNDDFTDGETHFPDYGDLKLKAPTGSAIYFEPLGDGDKCHPKALHAELQFQQVQNMCVMRGSERVPLVKIRVMSLVIRAW